MNSVLVITLCKQSCAAGDPWWNVNTTKFWFVIREKYYFTTENKIIYVAYSFSSWSVSQTSVVSKSWELLWRWWVVWLLCIVDLLLVPLMCFKLVFFQLQADMLRKKKNSFYITFTEGKDTNTYRQKDSNIILRVRLKCGVLGSPDGYAK